MNIIERSWWLHDMDPETRPCRSCGEAIERDPRRPECNSCRAIRDRQRRKTACIECGTPVPFRAGGVCSGCAMDAAA